MHTLAQDAADAFFSVTPMEPRDFIALGTIMISMEPDEYARTWADAVAIVTGQRASPDAISRYIDTVQARQGRVRAVLAAMQSSSMSEQRGIIDSMRQEAAASIGRSC